MLKEDHLLVGSSWVASSCIGMLAEMRRIKDGLVSLSFRVFWANTIG